MSAAESRKSEEPAALDLAPYRETVRDAMEKERVVLITPQGLGEILDALERCRAERDALREWVQLQIGGLMRSSHNPQALGSLVAFQRMAGKLGEVTP